MIGLQCPIVSLLTLSSLIGHVFCSVPSPTNLTLNCHNFKNVLYWNYSKPSLHPVFEVTIRSYNGGKQSVRTSKNYLDISSYTQDVDNAYRVSLVALLNESAVSTSQASTQFSYGEFPSKTKCLVDFPPLNISVWTRKFEIYFEHPSYIYGIEILNDTFIYQVEYNGIETEYNCPVSERVCTEKMHLPESLYGRCMDVHLMGNIMGIKTEISQNICCYTPDPDEKDLPTLVTTLACVMTILVMIILVGVVLYMKRTQIKTKSYKFLNILRAEHAVIVPEQPALSEVTSVGHMPLLENPEDVFTPTNSSPRSITHIPFNFPPVVESPGSQESEGVVDEEYSEDANISNGYDSRKFPVDIGETVDAYGPR